MASWLDQAAQGCVQVSSEVSRDEDPTASLLGHVQGLFPHTTPLCSFPGESKADLLDGQDVGSSGQTCAPWPRKWESPKRAKTACRVREAFQCCFAKHGAVLKGETSEGNWWMSSGTACEKNQNEQ